MRLILIVSMFVVVACGPAARNNDCVGPTCNSGTCTPGDMRSCYTGTMATQDVGPCHGGSQMCQMSGQWGNCVGETLPQAENCSDGIDNNCNGQVDENEDSDGDGFTTCMGDCCDSVECSNPAAVNPGAFDVPGDGVDNDCDGMVDNTTLLCDQGLASNSSNASDYAKAIDICQTTTMGSPKWGLIDAKLTLPDDQGTPDPMEYSIRPHFGTGLMPQGGVSMVLISSGVAAGKGDTNPNFMSAYASSKESGFPADFYAAHGMMLPNAPGCPPADTSFSQANDPVMLEFTIKVPSNAHSFSLKSNFYSYEFPEWTCSPYNDFFVVLLDSAYTGTPANPTDKNLAFYQQPNTTNIFPVGVNLANGNTGLFTQCVNGTTGCFGNGGTISTCIGTNELAGTGLDTPNPFACDDAALEGGGTGWLETSGNVNPGEIMKLRIAIWDTSDHVLDSLAVIDGFQWSVETTQPGTVIFRK